MTNVKSINLSDDDYDDMVDYWELQDASQLAKLAEASYWQLDMDSDYLFRRIFIDLWAPQVEKLRGTIPEDDFDYLSHLAHTSLAVHKGQELLSDSREKYPYDPEKPDGHPLSETERKRGIRDKWFNLYESSRHYILYCAQKFMAYLASNSVDVTFSYEDPDEEQVYRENLGYYLFAIVKRPGDNLVHYLYDECVFMNDYQRIVFHRSPDDMERKFMEKYRAGTLEESDLSAIVARLPYWWT